MKKKIVTLLIATTAMLSLVGCGSTYDKYVSIKDYKNMKITDTNLSQFDYSDEDVNNTIRSSIINYSPNLITETNEAINEKSCISFEGTATNESGEESQFSLSYKMYSELAEIDGLQEGVLGHKTDDEIDLTLNLSSGKLTAHIKITLVANDPLNSFTDDWVKEYGNNENVETKDDYYKNETKIIIIKKDQDDGKVLEGIEFQLLNDKKEVIYADLKTDSDGKIVIENLVPGNYYIKEIKTIDGYELYEYPIQVEVGFNQEVSVTVNNKKEEKPQIITNKTASKEIKRLPVTGM